jgi:uncharacterized sulfatase
MADFAFPNGPSWNEDLSAKPAHYQRWAQNRYCTASPTYGNRSYFGCNRFVDRMIGEVLEDVARHDRGRTWTVYTSDHGEMHGAHGGLAAKGPSTYDEIARIPLLIRGPGVVPGLQRATAVSHLDVLPTLLELAGVAVPAAVDGGSLLPVLGAEQPAREVPVEFHRYELIHDGFMDWSPMRALVGWNWKLTLHERYGDELYDSASDAHECRNRIADPAAAAVRDAMHDRLLAWMDARNDPLRGTAWRQRSWRDLGAMPFTATARVLHDDGVRPSYLEYHTGRPAGA